MKKKIVPAVLGIIKKDNKYLLTKRIAGDKRFHDKWQFPGGELVYGETIVEGLRRELKEELNVQVYITKQISQIFEVIRSDWHGIFINFFCTLKDDNCVIKLNHEASEFGWFSKRDIMKLDTLSGIKDLLKLI